MGRSYGEILAELITPFIAHPDCIRLQENTRDRHTELLAQVHKTDHSHVIGSNARMVLSLRRLLHAVARKRGETVFFQVLEPAVGTKENEERFKPKETWEEEDDRKLEHLLEMVSKESVEEPDSHHVHSVRDATYLHLTSRRPLSLEDQGALAVIFRAIGRGMGRATTFHASTNPQKTQD